MTSVSGELIEVIRVTWKDVSAGRVLVGSDRASLEGLVSSPFGYVPKKNADGSSSEEGRPIHDLQEPVNVGSPKELHPAVFTPAIRAGWLRVLVLQLLWPFLWALLSKSDIDAAFKRVWVALQDVDLFATDLPREDLLKAAWEEASEAEVDELLEEMSAFAPRIRE